MSDFKRTKLFLQAKVSTLPSISPVVENKIRICMVCPSEQNCQGKETRPEWTLKLERNPLAISVEHVHSAKIKHETMVEFAERSGRIF